MVPSCSFFSQTPKKNPKDQPEAKVGARSCVLTCGKTLPFCFEVPNLDLTKKSQSKLWITRNRDLQNDRLAIIHRDHCCLRIPILGADQIWLSHLTTFGKTHKVKFLEPIFWWYKLPVTSCFFFRASDNTEVVSTQSLAGAEPTAGCCQ